MRAFRKLFGDRVSSAIILVMAVYFLVLQVFVAGFTCGMTTQDDVGFHFVLCQPSQASTQTGDTQADFVHECPCAICISHEAVLLAALPIGSDLGAAYRAELDLWFGPLELPGGEATPYELGLSADRRGPPTYSI